MNKQGKEKRKVTVKKQSKKLSSSKNQTSKNKDEAKNKQASSKRDNKNILSGLFNKNTKEEKIDFRSKTAQDIAVATEIVDPVKLTEYIEGNNMPKYTLNYILHVYKTEIMKASTLLIRMVLRNGNVASFIVNTHAPVFHYMGGSYIIDPSKIKDDVTSGYSTLFYLQDFSLPYDPNIDVSKMRDRIFSIEDEMITDIVENINPKTLRATVKSTLIQQVMAGGLLDKQIRGVIIIMVINLILTIILMIGTVINSFI